MVSTVADNSGLFSASGLVIVITGGGTGLGLSMLSAAVQTGARKVYILGRRLDALSSAAQSVDADQSVVIPLKCDVADEKSVADAVKRIESDVGFVDVLVNNAGVSGPNQTKIYAANSIEELQTTLLSDDSDIWATTFAINSTASVKVSAAFLGLLNKANSRRGWESGKMEPGGAVRKRDKSAEVDEADVRTSQIITIASIAAYNRRVTMGLPYNGSKAATVAMGKSMANFLAPWGIRYNLICPGLFPSEMTEGLKMEAPVDAIPAHRPGLDDEMKSTFLYTVGKGGAYLNGNVQIVDGGRLAVMPGTY